MDKVVHFEIPADNTERARKFYTQTFNWEMNSIPEMKYTIIHTTEIDEKMMPKEKGAINGGMLQRQHPITNPVITINVEDINLTIEKIKKNGGEIVHDKFQVGNMGLSAYFKDTEGNILGLWQNL